MSTYPIVLRAQPQQNDVLHRFELIEGNIEGDGFEPISIWLKLPGAKAPTNVCMDCGAILEIPDGSIEAHLKKYQAEHGGVVYGGPICQDKKEAVAKIQSAPFKK